MRTVTIDNGDDGGDINHIGNTQRGSINVDGFSLDQPLLNEVSENSGSSTIKNKGEISGDEAIDSDPVGASDISGGAVKIIIDLEGYTRPLPESEVSPESEITCSVITWNLAEESPSEEDALFIKKIVQQGDQNVISSYLGARNRKHRAEKKRR